MKRKVLICLIIIFIISIIKLISLLTVHDNYVEKNVIVVGIIRNIKKYENKTVLDVKDNRITIYKNNNFNLGDKVKITGIRKIPNNNTVFNLFNYKKYLLSKKIKYVFINPDITIIKKNTNIFYTIKNNIIDHINKLDTKEYVSSFVLGDFSYVDSNIKNSIRNIGISHLFAVSGMHMFFL